MGVGMSTLDAQTSLYAEDRGCQIGVIRPIRVDHTEFFQVTIKTDS
jgi:hypothetical protein